MSEQQEQKAQTVEQRLDSLIELQMSRVETLATNERVSQRVGLNQTLAREISELRQLLKERKTMEVPDPSQGGAIGSNVPVQVADLFAKFLLEQICKKSA